MNYLYLLICIEVLLLLWVMFYTKMDIISPSFVTIFLFLLSSICVAWNEEYWDVQFKAVTFAIVGSGLFLIALTERFVGIFVAQKRINKPKWIDQKELIECAPIYVYDGTKIVFLIVTTILLIIYIIAVLRHGKGGTSLLSAIGVVHTDSEIRVGTIPTIAVRILNKMVYPCLFILAFNVSKKSMKKSIWLLIPILESCLAIFFSGVRSTYLYLIIACVVYFIIFKRFQNGWKSVKLKKYIKPLIILLMLFLIIFVSSRSIVKNHEFTSTPLEYLTFYLGSPLHLFNKIIEDLNKALPLADDAYPGTYSFTWLYQELYKFGILSRETIDNTRFVSVGGSFYGGGNAFYSFQ